LLGRLGLAGVPKGISSFGRRHRAYVKVQDGCRMNCTYCIIPTVRPSPTSRPVCDVLEEVRRLVGNGYREIVLVGIHLGHYGLEQAASGTARVNLAGLVRRIAELEGEFRIRISSLEAAEVNAELVALAADHPLRVCPHLHLSLQSGSEAVLERMGRPYTCRQFVRKCRLIRRLLDRPALTTDVIVGFPGETEADFGHTCRVVEEVGFAKTHVFRFSPRQGTPAAEMPDQVPMPIRRRRAAELSELGRRLRQRYFESLAGRQLQVLVESPLQDRPGMLLGTSGRYTPVELPGGEDRIGQLVEVTAGGTGDGRIRAADPPQAVRS